MARPDRTTRWDIGDVLARTDLAALLDSCTPSTGSGNRRRWHCPVPDHHDNHASVTMHTDGRGHERWRCWSGDDSHRGDAIDLVMATQRLDRAAAIDHLAQRAGLRHDQPAPPAPARKQPTRPTGPVPLDPAVLRYVEACTERLWQRDMLPVRRWLAGRGFTKEVLQANRVGADPGRPWMARPRGLPRGDRLAAVFPALDPAGRVRYMQARYLDPKLGGPKFDNPSAAMGSNPRLAWTVPAGPTRRPGTLIVCEGIPDALTAAQYGFRAAGVLGAQYPDRGVATRLATTAEREHLDIVAVIDADDAGRAFGQRLGDLIAESGLDLGVVEPPVEGQDLNDWARSSDRWADWIEPATEPPAIDHHHTRPALEVPSA